MDTPTKSVKWRHCADCDELIVESEASAAPRCFGCKGQMHAECALTGREGDAACEDCKTAEDVRYLLVSSRGNGEGRDPILDEGEIGYLRLLPDPPKDSLHWDMTLAELDALNEEED